MISLPDILKEESNDFSGHSNRSSSSNISSFFCNGCAQDLELPVRKINPQILPEYEERYAHIRNMQRLLHQEEEMIFQDDRAFHISSISKESLQIYAFGFPLIRQSQLVMTTSNELDWGRLKEKILKRQSRCQILQRTPQGRQEVKTEQARHAKKNQRILPPLTTCRKGRVMYDAHVEHRKVPLQKMLCADPEVVVFDNIEIGRYYEQKCKITNISSRKCKFQIHPLDRNSQFRVMWNHFVNTLAPGLSCYVVIEFFCKYIMDFEEELIITSENSKDLVILIQTISVPPYLIEVNNNSCNLDKVVDSLIDCGSHFVGEKSKTFLTLRNVGHSARFCFITEIDWASLEFSINSSNSLQAGAFTIKPMLFSLKKDQEVAISVTAVAPSNGLHTARLFLLCDNGALNHVDVVCDGCLYEPSLINGLDMSKTFDVDIQDIEVVNCFFDLGQVLTSDQKYSFFFLLNTGVNISYHWEIRTVSPPGTKPLPENTISIQPISGRLDTELVNLFCLMADTATLDPGVYRTLLVLVVDDLPKKCVPFDYCDHLLPEEGENEPRSIEAKHIEVWMECLCPIVTLLPYIIDFSDFPLVCGSPVETREIIVKNESPGILTLTWKCYEDSPIVRFEIVPCQLQCDKYSTNVCTLSVEAVEVGSFEFTYWCMSDKGNVKVELLVKGLCSKPQLTIFTDSVDFGLVKNGSPHIAPLVAKNCSLSDSFQWTVDELVFSSPDEGLITSPVAQASLSTTEGECCHKDSEVLVNYQFNSQEDEMWCSVVEWDGQCIPITADVQAADVSLSSHTLHADVLSLGLPNTLTVMIRNHRLFSTAFCWGLPTSHDQVAVEVVPRCGMLDPIGSLVMEIQITPHTLGPLDNLYVPCFVEGWPQPLLLKIEGNVEGLRLRIEWDSNEQHYCIVWPLPKSRSSEDEDESLEPFDCICPPNSQQLSETSLQNYCNIIPLDSNFSITSNVDHIKPTLSEDYTEVCEEAADEEDDNVSQASSIPYLNWPLVGGRYTRDPMDDEWESHFNNLFILEELSREIDDENASDVTLDHEILCFHDIPVRKAVTQNIYIRNDTIIPSFYETSVIYNFERVQEENENLHLEKVLKKIKAKERDDVWVERANRQRGLTVFLSPPSGQLPPDDYVILSVTVVALSWGDYCDIIVLQVGDLDLICIPLKVTVTQPPVTAPQLLRFGSLPLRSNPQSQFLCVENSSTVPVYICWQMFTPSLNQHPFSVMLFDDDPFKLRMTSHYGSFSSSFFKVMEIYTFMKPNSSKTVEVNFYPHLINLNVAEENFSQVLRAHLVGHVYVADEAKNMTKSECCVRVDGSELAPLQVDLEARVELPLLSLLNVYNYQLTFKCSAYDVMSLKDRIWNKEKVITVQNNCCTDLKAWVYTVGYFHVTKIEYPCAYESSRVLKDFIFLRPDETCEVTVKCEVTEQTLLDCFEEDADILNNETIHLGSVEHGLLCFEQEDVKQIVKLELLLYQPLLHLSETSLDFGSVYIEDTKMLIITITAPVGEESFEAFLKSGGDGPFSINVSSGVLKPKVGFLLQVYFSPKACIFYEDTLVVRSYLEKMFCTIPLSGKGTFDYKTHIY